MKDRLEFLLSLLLAIAVVAMAATFIFRQLIPRDSVQPPPGGRRTAEVAGEPQFHPKWEGWLPFGNNLDADRAPVVIIEFTDLECTYCARFHQTLLKRTREVFGPAVSFTLIHLPLKMHRFAEISAVAAECAAEQGRFSEFVDAVFLKQDSIGLKSWDSYAIEARVPDPAGLSRCMEGEAPLERVKAARALADRIGVSATPTLFVNGWRLPGPPEEAALFGIIEDLEEEISQ
jgi:protein-disulfide isomerase